MDQLAGPLRGDLVCFSHLSWDFVFQRPQHLLSRATDSFKVHYFEEPRYEDLDHAHLDITVAPQGVCILTPVLSSRSEPGDALGQHRRLVAEYLSRACQAPSVAWYYTPAALKFSRYLDFPVTVYDCMDELSHFKGAAPDLVPLEAELLEKADVVFTGGLSLYEAKRRRHDNVHAFPSSVDTNHFRPARKHPVEEPADVARIARPRIGYFGVIDERIDYELIDVLASARPEWQFLMIGPTAKIDPESLPSRENIHWLGRKCYSDLPRYLACLDVGFMPFALNASTRFISPTKTPEFLAAGCPVVSTPITDVVRTWGTRGLVEIASDMPSAAASINRLLERRDHSDWLQRVDEQLASGSWDRTWSLMLRELDQARLRVTRASLIRAAPAAAVHHV